MRKLEKMAREINDGLALNIKEAVWNEFQIDVETTLDLLGTMCMVTSRVDGRAFTKAQKAFLKAWSDGYERALILVKEADKI